MLVSYVCISGYVNATETMTKSCRADGNFSENLISCERMACSPAPTVTHGSSSAATGFYQDKISYQCDPGSVFLQLDIFLFDHAKQTKNVNMSCIALLQFPKTILKLVSLSLPEE